MGRGAFELSNQPKDGHMSQPKTDEIGLYLVKGTAGGGRPGAPTLRFSLTVNAVTGAITGQGVITQALKPPSDKIPIVNIVGHVQSSAVGEYTKLFYLEGHGVESLPPPAIGTLTPPFTAQFAVNDGWNGKGGWTLGRDAVDNVMVNSG